MSRFAAGVAYQGSDYFGWQKQMHDSNTVQQHVEEAISFVANHPVELVCAGRTDSGVHATGQVVHFDSSALRSLRGWRLGANTQLPKNIRLEWVESVPADFHARFSATYRRYQYILNSSSQGDAIFAGLVTSCKETLNVTAMNQAAQYLLGEHDFSSFRAAHCQSKSSWRNIQVMSVKSYGNYVVIDITANAFLYHMVRNIVGALLMVGSGKYPIEWLSHLLSAKDRSKAPPTAPADGLYLVEVGYKSVYNLPIGGKPLPFVSS